MPNTKTHIKMITTLGKMPPRRKEKYRKYVNEEQQLLDD
jgi:hypothetical protein